MSKTVLKIQDMGRFIPSGGAEGVPGMEALIQAYRLISKKVVPRSKTQILQGIQQDRCHLLNPLAQVQPLVTQIACPMESQCWLIINPIEEA